MVTIIFLPELHHYTFYFYHFYFILSLFFILLLLSYMCSLYLQGVCMLQVRGWL